MLEIEIWMKKVETDEKSKLDPYKDDIRTLIKNKYSAKKIKQFLFEIKKIDVSLSHLYKYIKDLKNAEDIIISSNPKSEPKQEEKKEDQEDVKKKDEKPKVDPFEALKKLQEENKKNGVTKREVPYWEPQKKPWEK